MRLCEVTITDCHDRNQPHDRKGSRRKAKKEVELVLDRFSQGCVTRRWRSLEQSRCLLGRVAQITRPFSFAPLGLVAKGKPESE